MFQQQRPRTDVHCPVICVITCPSQCRHKTSTDQSGTGLFTCVWVQVRDEQIVTHVSVNTTNVNVPSRVQQRPPVLSHEMASPSAQQGLEIVASPAPFWHRFCRQRHEMVSLRHGSLRSSLTFQSREEFGISYYLLSNC